jgi:hypothetical protein
MAQSLQSSTSHWAKADDACADLMPLLAWRLRSGWILHVIHCDSGHDIRSCGAVTIDREVVLPKVVGQDWTWAVVRNGMYGMYV